MRNFGSLLIILLIGVALVGGYTLSTASNAAGGSAVPAPTSASTPGPRNLVPTDSLLFRD